MSAKEHVISIKFEDCDANNTNIWKRPSYVLVLSIVTCKGCYIWGIPHDGKAVLLFSELNNASVDMKILPTPTVMEDKFFQSRPIIAFCDNFSCAPQLWRVRFISLIDRKLLCHFSFESRVVSIDATDRFIVISRIDVLTVFSALTLTECFTINHVKPLSSPNFVPRDVPFCLGTRWLAFPDSKPLCQHLSRCGDASADESQPLTTTIMNMNKRILGSLSALVTSTVGQANPGQTPHISQHRAPQHGDYATAEQSDPDISPGYVTIVDLVTLDSQYKIWRELNSKTLTIDLSSRSHHHVAKPDSTPVNQPMGHGSGPTVTGDAPLSGILHVNVHDHVGSGAVVAHFMAHRWAPVALLKFDPSGLLLFTACSRGHSFNLFRISSHPCDQRQTAVHHLYILVRGTTPCQIIDATFSQDSRWVAVSSNHGTTHIFPITAYGGPITVRTHTRPHVVNRTSRYYRSSGFEEHHLTRPQPDRSLTEPAPSSSATNLASVSSPNVGSLASCSSSLSGDHRFRGTGPDSRSLPFGLCQTAPIAGFASHCSHLGVPETVGNMKRSKPGSVVSIPSELKSADSSTSESTLAPRSSSNLKAETDFLLQTIEGMCACPPNAVYNTVNSRLPPYPEPCHIKPEARLKHFGSASLTSGAIGAATSAIEAVTPGSGSLSIGPPQPTPSRIRYSSHTSELVQLGHTGICGHDTLPAPGHAGLPYVYQQYQTVRASGDQDFLTSADTSILLVGRFASPICFLPNQPRLRTISGDYRVDPYGNKSRTANTLFILTAEFRLIEYDLCAIPAEPGSFGEKLYQDGPIRLDCAPIGEWDLHTDVIYSPPFPKQHPLIAVASELVTQVNPDGGSYTSPDASTMPSEQTTPSTDTQFSDNIPSSTPAHNTTDSIESGTSDSTVRTIPSGPDIRDAFSYWYSQVEITTHLGPLRRVWMGPQFKFRIFPKRNETSPVMPPLDSIHPKTSPRPNPTSSFHPTLLAMLANQDPSCIVPPPIDLLVGEHVKPDSDTASMSRASGEFGSVQSRKSISKTILMSHLASGLGIETTGGSLGSSLRWRNRSGEPTRPLSIAGVSGNSVHIEGGSYQDSSLGSSLSSLVGRSSDDVVQCIADAMQDEEIHWSTERITLDGSHGSASPRNGTSCRGIWQFNVRPTPAVSNLFRHSPVQSALSEADFPSRSNSPSMIPEMFPIVEDNTALPDALRSAIEFGADESETAHQAEEITCKSELNDPKPDDESEPAMEKSESIEIRRPNQQQQQPQHHPHHKSGRKSRRANKHKSKNHQLLGVSPQATTDDDATGTSYSNNPSLATSPEQLGIDFGPVSTGCSPREPPPPVTDSPKPCETLQAELPEADGEDPISPDITVTTGDEPGEQNSGDGMVGQNPADDCDNSQVLFAGDGNTDKTDAY